MTDDVPIYLSANYRQATRVLSLAATGMLMDLICRAALGKSTTMAVNAALLLSLSEHKKDKRNAQKRFDELVKKGFVQKIESGRFLIAPGLWAFEADLERAAGPSPL